MDPNACLRLYHAALGNDDLPAAMAHAKDLLTWLKGGGFPPAWNVLQGEPRRFMIWCNSHGLDTFGALHRS